MDPPLVTSDDDDAGTPLLSSGPHHSEDDDDQMMALIMQRSPEIEPTMSSPSPREERRNIFTVLEAEQEAAALRQQSPQFSFVVVVAGTLTLLQCVLVWSAYLADSWSDVHLLTSIDWQKKEYLSFFLLDGYIADIVLQTIDLGSILSILRASKHYTLLALLAVTAVCIPCLCIIVNPMRVAKHYHTIVATSSYSYRKKRGVVSYWNLSVRTSLVIVYFFILLDVTTSITLEWTDTVIVVRNCFRGAVLWYLVGMTAAIGVAMTLQCGNYCRRHKSNDDGGGATTRRNSATVVVRIPPPAAFRHVTLPGFDDTMDAYYDDDDDRIEESTPATTTTQEGRWYSCLTWQLGLATGVMWLPSLSLPIVKLSYHGLAAEFMTVTEREIYLWQLPRLLWHPCTDNKWLLVVFQVLLILQVLVLPLVGLFCGLTSLRSSCSQKRYLYRKYLSCLHPMLNGITFAATIILFAPSLESITRYLFNEDDSSSSSGLCAKFHNIVGEPCLSVGGATLPGSWFFLVQSLLLEVFCVMVVVSSTR